MEWLVVIHVLSAVLGLGPAYAFPLMLRKASAVDEMKRNVQQVSYLELFPKVFGTLAVLSGLALFFIGSYGSFVQTWIIGSLAVYVVTEILVIGFMAPATRNLLKMMDAPEIESGGEPALAMVKLYSHVRNLHVWAGILGLLIFILMVAKPQ
ncbi:DUF2269 family protein [Paenibacillus thermotolerans]|uniref:DUF2269 family protein n=1 Tax=Paenibacillus thermotolerans TaxID=3027807 RepID=UPI0023677F2F|nr:MULTISPECIES: DUF2269 family protein [unclassified Paenibacillus]